MLNFELSFFCFLYKILNNIKLHYNTITVQRMHYEFPKTKELSDFLSHQSQKRSGLLDTTAHLQGRVKWVIQVSMLREGSTLIIYLKLADTILCISVYYFNTWTEIAITITHHHLSQLTVKQSKNVELVSLAEITFQLKKWKHADFRVIKIM